MVKSNPLELDITKSCILVGNGPSVMYEKLGYIIDSFDEVLRFNQCAIKGFEEYTGYKTTIWSTFGRGMLPIDEDLRPNKVIYTHGEMGQPAYAPEKLWRIPLSYYNELRSIIQKETKKEHPSVLLPSSGVLMIKWLLDNVYDELTIIGFDNFSKDKSGKHHYWVDRSFKKPKEHDDEWESNYIENLILNGKIKRLI
jgi:hypothetical protein